MSDDPGPNPQELEEPLDVQWVAHIVPEDGHPTPAAGDSTIDAADWVNVEDPNFGDREDPEDDDGQEEDD
jgi:hypothetical protein